MVTLLCCCLTSRLSGKALAAGCGGERFATTTGGGALPLTTAIQRSHPWFHVHEMMHQRDRQPELMDDPKLPRDQHLQALAGLARINRVSGVARTIYHFMRQQAIANGDRPLSVLDVASGAGDTSLACLKRARKDGLNVQLTMIDVSSVAVEEQQRRAKQMGLDALSLQQDCLRSPLPSGFDLVICSLFMHHLDDHDAFRLLQSMQAATDRSMLICDLERSSWNEKLIKVATRVLSRSPVVHTDGVLSIRAAYTMNEFKSLAEDALARPVRVRRVFPCRFVATFEEETVSDAVPAFA